MPAFRRPEKPSPPATTSTRSNVLIGSFGNLADKVGRFDGRTEHHDAIAAALIAAILHAGRFVLVQDLGSAFCFPVRRQATCSLTKPRKTCDVVCPSLSTSTPNSVPRSVTVAVGV